MNRNIALLLGALAGAAAALYLRGRSALPGAEPVEDDPRATELRRKLAEARDSAVGADDDGFEAAGMGAETVVVEEPRATKPPAPKPAATKAKAAAAKPRAAASKPRATRKSRAVPPAPVAEPEGETEADLAADGRLDEFEAMRRRVHEEGRAAAEEMRRPPDSGS